tara:strand:+ start:1931 stop:2167 length:237 start_codon:yes stop_codon:yes gene_type:complete
MYKPKVNDRVKYMEHTGWVYCITDQYFTLEISAKPMVDDAVSIHKKHHSLLVVYKERYHEVEYLGYRNSQYDDTYTKV